ncbi:hypothetical protein IU501_03540 [Nocardia otitidiscaviarum]|uniref:hypothetical protein n=1 Tax=Nocardia otitidiscaviarum TaxID=1823 RepID=UPI0004A6BC80|nr:hypothetical protein [Nocardia otitidiscaviarum]MBF6132072.1 hypothetical protein [Nocardia otitidiscaviarum]MBF6483202.1 hypothetical protein [Nocardia otitidiscaviarum]
MASTDRRRLTFLVAMVPFPILVMILFGLMIAGVLILLSLAIGTAGQSASADLHYQCDTALGPDPSLTETPVTSTVPPTGAATLTARPSTNPYAALTVDPDDTEVSQWQRDCVEAMRSAPYQLPALRTPDTGPAGACAGQLAMTQEGRRWTEGDDGASGPADLSRSVVYSAALAATTTGTCVLVAAPTPTADRHGCAPVLPTTIAGQGVCGQRVDPSAASAGDLVFWEYRDNAPTRVGVVVGDGQIVTGDPSAGGFVRQGLPRADDVRVKRVLDMGSGS